MAPLSVPVTGSSGFIGTNVVWHLHTAGHRVTGLDHIPPKDQLPEGVAFHVCDIRHLRWQSAHFQRPAFSAWLVASEGLEPFHESYPSDVPSRAAFAPCCATGGCYGTIATCGVLTLAEIMNPWFLIVVCLVAVQYVVSAGQIVTLTSAGSLKSAGIEVSVKKGSRNDLSARSIKVPPNDQPSPPTSKDGLR